MEGAEEELGGDIGSKETGACDGSSDHENGDEDGKIGGELILGAETGELKSGVSRGSNKDDRKSETGMGREEVGAGDNEKEEVGAGRGIEDMDGLVCEAASEVMIGSGMSTVVGVKKVSSSVGKST